VKASEPAEISVMGRRNADYAYREWSATMLYRQEKQGKIAIMQPTHAWLSGQLAHAWGNERFGDVEPWKEVCLGAGQHDVGHTPWEKAPTLNPQTGLPYSFLEMPRQLHVQIWSEAASCVLPQGRYAALLVSLHGTRLYQHYDAANDLPENAQAVQRAPFAGACIPGGTACQLAIRSTLQAIRD
jgi:Protein of unknown function (DUF3891)